MPVTFCLGLPNSSSSTVKYIFYSKEDYTKAEEKIAMFYRGMCILINLSFLLMGNDKDCNSDHYSDSDSSEPLYARLNNKCIQHRVLAESQLEFKKAMEFATVMETADRNTCDLKNGNLSEKTKESQVDCVNKDPPKQPPRDSKQLTKECYCCGGRLHELDECRRLNQEIVPVQLPTHVPYGISSAPGIFQLNMENQLQNIPYVIVRVDDILVSEAYDEDCLNNLEGVLKRLASAGL
ncbi:hypothetical protein ACROYT_G014740 [Oculina patagonica]